MFETLHVSQDNCLLFRTRERCVNQILLMKILVSRVHNNENALIFGALAFMNGRCIRQLQSGHVLFFQLNFFTVEINSNLHRSSFFGDPCNGSYVTVGQSVFVSGIHHSVTCYEGLILPLSFGKDALLQTVIHSVDTGRRITFSIRRQNSNIFRTIFGAVLSVQIASLFRNVIASLNFHKDKAVILKHLCVACDYSACIIANGRSFGLPENAF